MTIRSVTEETVIGRRSSDINCHTISLLHLDSRQHVVDLELPYSKGDFPILPHFQLAGSCNGIVCAVVTDCPCKVMANVSCENYKYINQEIYLWNPATKHSNLISPHIIHKKTNITFVSYGFGFDSIANDFKVVRFVSYDGKLHRASPRTCHRTEVYSGNINAWREVQFKVKGTPKYPVFDASVRGVLYSTWSQGVLRFDFHKEVFNYDISFPVSIWIMTDSMYSDTRVIEYKDSIAVIIYNEDLNSEISLWKVDDPYFHGGSEVSWTRIFRFDLALGLDWVHGYLNSGHILVKEWGCIWFLCDVSKKELKKVPAEFYVCETFKYTKSLISIGGFRQVKWNANEGDN